MAIPVTTKCDTCGVNTPGAALLGFKLTTSIDGERYSIVVRLCTRGCKQAMKEWLRSNRTTEPPEIKTMWGGQPLKPLKNAEGWCT